MEWNESYNWLSLGIGVVGVLLASYFYWASKKQMQLSYLIRHTTLIGGPNPALPDAVSIFYHEKRIENLHKMNLIIWNSGTQSILRSALVETDPIQIVLQENSTILRPSILRCSTKHNDITVQDDSDGQPCLTLYFRYLEPHQGLNLEILYSGENHNPTLSGTVVGMPNGLRHIREYGDDNAMDLHIGKLPILLTFWGIAVGVAFYLGIRNGFIEPWGIIGWVMVVVFSVFCVVAFAMGSINFWIWSGMGVKLPTELLQ